MKTKDSVITRRVHPPSLIIVCVLVILCALVACGPSAEDLVAVDFTPLTGYDLEVSTPGEEGLDPALVAELYYNAAKLETIYSLLIVKNGKLIAEEYFNEGSIDQQNNVQIVPADFVVDSMQSYTEDPPAAINRRNYKRFGYGYQWWTVRAGDQEYVSAQGHGGQVIALLDEFDMVIVLTADPFWLEEREGK